MYAGRVKSRTSGGRVSTAWPRVELSRCCVKDVGLFFYFEGSVSAQPKKVPSVNKTPFVCEASHRKHTQTRTQTGSNEGREEASRVAYGWGMRGWGGNNIAQMYFKFTAAFRPILWEHFPRIRKDKDLKGVGCVCTLR